MESAGLGFGCKYLPIEGTLVADIRDDQVPESLVCKVGQKVNWFQFSEERRLVRAGLKRKVEERKLKKEREAEGQGFEKPLVLGKKRCDADQKFVELSFPSSLSLTVKSKMEFATQCSSMGVMKSSGKGVGKGSGKGSLLISPAWIPDEVQSVGNVIQETKVLLKECQMSLSQRSNDVVGIESKLQWFKILLTDRKVMLEESRQQMNAFSLAEAVLRSAIEEKMSARVDYGRSIEFGVSKDSMKDRTDLEDIIAKKGMEECTLSHCDEVVQGFSSTILGLEDQLSRSEETKNTFSIRVLSVERLSNQRSQTAQLSYIDIIVGQYQPRRPWLDMS